MTEFKSFYKLNNSTVMYAIILGVSIVFSFILSFVLVVALGVDDKGVLPIPEWLSYILNAVLYLLFLTAFMLYSKLSKVNVIKAQKLDKKPDVGIVFICIGLSIACVFFFNSFIGLVDSLIENIKPAENLTLGTSWWAVIMVILTMSIMPGIIEELIFRGVIFKGLLSRFKPAAAIVLSALMFALFHFSIHQFVYQFILGIIFACIVYFAGSVIYSMIAHFLNNFIVIVLGYLSPLLSKEGASTEIGRIGEIIMAVGLALVGTGVVILLLLAIKSRIKEKSAKDKAYQESNTPISQAEEPDLAVSDAGNEVRYDYESRENLEARDYGLTEAGSEQQSGVPAVVQPKITQQGLTGFFMVLGAACLLWILFAVV